MTNKKFAQEDVLFREACDKAGIEPTIRQASKWLNGKGLALKFARKGRSRPVTTS